MDIGCSRPGRVESAVGNRNGEKEQIPPVCRTESPGRPREDTRSGRQHPGAEHRLELVKANRTARCVARSLSDHRLAYAIAGIKPGRAFASDRNRAADDGYHPAAYGARRAHSTQSRPRSRQAEPRQTIGQGSKTQSGYAHCGTRGREARDRWAYGSRSGPILPCGRNHDSEPEYGTLRTKIRFSVPYMSVPDNDRHFRRRRRIAAALGANDAVDDGHADSRKAASCTLSRMFFPGECCALSMMTKSAERPISMRPQSSARMRAVLPVARQNAISAGNSPSDDSNDTIRRIPSGCTPESAGASVPNMTRLRSPISRAVRNVNSAERSLPL